jgi:hypothetical protein
VLAQIGLGFSWVPFAIIAAFALSYLASLACGFVGLAFILSRGPRLELPALWVSGSGSLVMTTWFVLVVCNMPSLLAINVLATIVGLAPLILCVVVLRCAIVRR